MELLFIINDKNILITNYLQGTFLIENVIIKLIRV